jgi:hypothetical protein
VLKCQGSGTEFNPMVTAREQGPCGNLCRPVSDDDRRGNILLPRFWPWGRSVLGDACQSGEVEYCVFIFLSFSFSFFAVLGLF